MENTANTANTAIVKPYSLTELLPILTAFSQASQLFDRAFHDERLMILKEGLKPAASFISSEIDSFIKDVVDASLGR